MVGAKGYTTVRIHAICSYVVHHHATAGDGITYPRSRDPRSLVGTYSHDIQHPGDITTLWIYPAYHLLSVRIRGMPEACTTVSIVLMYGVASAGIPTTSID